MIDCIGDSITAGVQSPTYPRILKQLFEEQGWERVQVNNRGKNGATVSEYSALIGEQNEPPRDYALVVLGSNDTRSTVQTSLGEFEKAYRMLIEKLLPQYNQVLLGTLPPYYGSISIYWQGDEHIFNQPERITEELNPSIERIGREKGLTVVDLHTPMEQAGSAAYKDGIHPNPKGNEILARTWYEHLQPLIET